MSAYYNEIDPFAAKWLRQLIAAGHIADGEVDTRSIEEVDPSDLEGFTQCHFFAGIGGWSYALRLAGWADDVPVWTGSCPCQPFSTAAAGRQRGTDDKRHLWPVWEDLISECKPGTVFGEQVASPAGRSWLSAVRSEMEALGYEVGGADLCAASIGAPHIRQRLFWVADSGYERREANSQLDSQPEPGIEAGSSGEHSAGCGDVCRVATPAAQEAGGTPEDFLERNRKAAKERVEARDQPYVSVFAGQGSPWADVEWVHCSDGKARPIKPGLEPLAHGLPGGLARGYGNAIIPQVAAEFILAFIETKEDR